MLQEDLLVENVIKEPENRGNAKEIKFNDPLTRQDIAAKR